MLLAAVGRAARPTFSDEAYDLILTNGVIIDGTGSPGFRADLVIFDPQRIADRATVDGPWKAPEGIFGVIVKGRAAVLGGKLTGALAGQPVRRPAPR